MTLDWPRMKTSSHSCRPKYWPITRYLPASEMRERLINCQGARPFLIESLEAERATGEKSRAEGEARLRVIRDPLQIKISALYVRLGLAYRQLKLCAAYATEADAMLETKFNKTEIRSQALNGAMEQVKALGGRGFYTQ